MVVSESLNTITESPIADRGDGVGNGNRNQTRATFESPTADRGDGVRDSDRSKTRAMTVFVNRIISITCTLNDRKVIA